MAAWSFMYSARSASGMASLPLRRECVFVSVSLGGLAPLLCINVVICLLSLGVEAYYGVADPALMGLWLAAVSLELVFFYGFALVCAQLTGNLAVLPVVYMVLNFTAVLVENLVSHMTLRFVYGAGRMSEYKLAVLSPAIGMIKSFDRHSRDVYDPDRLYFNAPQFHIGGWGTMLAYAAVGLAFAALALWLYRRRRMESAGDVVAVNILKPVFKYCMTFGGALCIGSLLYEYLGTTRSYVQWTALALMIFFMLIGAFIGYFASEMLIHKSFRVWRGGGRWLGLGVSALVVVALMLSMELDMYGYERRVPDPERVKSVYITADSGDAKISDPENIAAVTRLHRSVVENKQHYESFDHRESYYEYSDFATGRRSMSMYINYELDDGSNMRRQYYGLVYYLGDKSSQADARAAQELFNTPEAIAYRKSTAIEFTADTIFSAAIECSILPEDVEKANETTDEVYDSYGDRVAEALKYGYYEAAAQLSGEDDTELQYSAVWSLTPEEAAELYNDCILPDMAEGTIGTVWIITDEEYENTVYDARISIDARVLRQEIVNANVTAPGDPNYRYEYFYTVPTVNSVRTNRWLEEHGVILRTVAETRGRIAEYGG